MQIFIDSAILEEIKEAYSWGIIDGVTTNPSLIKKAVNNFNKKEKKISIESYIKKILKITKGTPVSLEVTSTTYEEMIKEAESLYKKFNPTAKNVYIKIPVNPCLENQCSSSMDGIKAIKHLSKKKIPVNCTLIFTPEQSLLAAKAGAKFVSPFVGRENDFIRNKAHIKFEKSDYMNRAGIKSRGKTVNDEGIVSGVDLIEQTSKLFKTQKIKSKILAASIRNPRELREVAIAGADIATLPFSVIKQLVTHEKTTEGMKNFTQDTIKEYKRLGK